MVNNTAQNALKLTIFISKFQKKIATDPSRCREGDTLSPHNTTLAPKLQRLWHLDSRTVGVQTLARPEQKFTATLLTVTA